MLDYQQTTDYYFLNESKGLEEFLINRGFLSGITKKDYINFFKSDFLLYEISILEYRDYFRDTYFSSPSLKGYFIVCAKEIDKSYPNNNFLKAMLNETDSHLNNPASRIELINNISEEDFGKPIIKLYFLVLIYEDMV